MDYLGATLILVGAAFTLVAGLGVVKLPDLFSRMHAAAKPQLFGLFLMCTGLTIMMQSWYWFGICTTVLTIQVIAAPIASHMLGRAAYREGRAQTQHLVIDELASRDRPQAKQQDN